MNTADYIYRAAAGVWHWLSASNTLGHGVQSPYLYYIVRFLMYDDNRYYAFSGIERERERLLRANKQIDVVDLGTGSSGKRRVAEVARRALMPAKDAQMLFRLVNYLKPQVAVELGTSLGITTAYLSSAMSNGRVLTFEGSEQVAAEAKKVWHNLKLKDNIRLVLGNIDDELPDIIGDVEVVDFALIDANHTEDATLRYFDILASKCADKSIIAIDDIHYSREMGNAWKKIKKDNRVSATMDIYGMGLVFFDKHYLRRDYRLRV